MSDDEKFSFKDAKYKNHQDDIFYTMLKKIRFNDNTQSFCIDDIDREYMLDVMYEKIKKYHHFNVHGRVDMNNKNSHISLVKNVFTTRGIKLTLRTVKIIDENGKKLPKKKYYVFQDL